MPKLIIYFLILIWSLCYTFPVHAKNFSITLLDVGQGESVLIQNGSQKFIYDCGPDDTILTRLGNILAPFDRHIDALFLSHPHADHLYGCLPLLENYQVDKIFAGPISCSDLVCQHFIDNNQITTLDHNFKPIIYQGIKFDIIYPVAIFDEKEARINPHHFDLILKVTFPNNSILLTGDLNEDQEKELIENLGLKNIHVSILQIPHHGSASGLLPDFFNRVNPQICLIPVGIDNKFNHPDPKILDKLSNCQVRRTDIEGNIDLKPP